MKISTQLAQFGGGFQPVATKLTGDSATNEGVLKNLESAISLVLGILTIIGSLFFLVYFFTAAYKIIMAGGDSSKLSSAWQQMVYSILGLIILVTGYFIVGLIGSIVGIDILNPAEMIKTIAPI